MIIDSDYNHEVWNTTEYTFIGYCKCKYCGEEFLGRFVEAVHEHIECPRCGRNLSWGER